ncbi:MAG: hypothetical protein GY851_30580 [bacterium]|nr:hypothetical protein [bacterium]
MAELDSSCCIIGIDAGTTGLKSLVFDATGAVLSRAYREYGLANPRPGHFEQDPSEWWDALCATVRGALQQGQIDPARVAGVSISFQGSTFVLLGNDGTPLRPAVSWMDRRANEIPGKDEERLFATTGLRTFPGWTGSALRWFAKHDVDVLRRTRCVALVGDYFVHRLTGNLVTDYSSASRTRLFDVARRTWVDDLVAECGLEVSQLPRVDDSGAVAGVVSAAAAQACGLKAGTPVVLGGFDQSCMSLGAGALAPDTLLVSLGTATMVSVSTRKPVVDPERRVTTSCHVAPDTWCLQAPIMTTGAVLRWWRDGFFAPREGGYEAMDRAAAEVAPGADGLIVLPEFNGSGTPSWDSHERGAFLGLTLAHTQGHIIRAIMEGVALSARTNLDIIEELGCAIDTVRIVGGGAESALWTEIIGDVLGKPRVQVAEPEVGTLGAAMLAGVGAGVFASLDEAVAAMAPQDTQVDFCPERHNSYQDVYERHQRARRALRNGIGANP